MSESDSPIISLLNRIGLGWPQDHNLSKFCRNLNGFFGKNEQFTSDLRPNLLDRAS